MSSQFIGEFGQLDRIQILIEALRNPKEIEAAIASIGAARDEANAVLQLAGGAEAVAKQKLQLERDQADCAKQMAGMEAERDFAIDLGLRLGLQSVDSLSSVLDVAFDASPERASKSLEKCVGQLLGSGAQEDAAQLVKESIRSSGDKLRDRAEPSALRTIGKILLDSGLGSAILPEGVVRPSLGRA